MSCGEKVSKTPAHKKHFECPIDPDRVIVDELWFCEQLKAHRANTASGVS
jgi:hypothetical protein